VYDAFLDIVPAAARRLAVRHTSSDLERLREQRARCEAAVSDGAALVNESTEFSLLIVELAGNPVLAVLSRLLAEVVRAHRQAMTAYFEAKPGVQAKRAKDVLESTATVIDMIEADDPRVEDFLRLSLDAIQRKALRIPVRDPLQLV